MSWFRLYVETMDDPKVMQLDPKVFRAWVICLCLAKEGNAGYGIIPPASVVAFKLHVSESAAAKYMAELVEKQLIDVSGNVSTPHNWNGRQYQSDVSTTRVQRFRNKQIAVSGNANETFQKPPQSTEYRVQSTEESIVPTSGTATPRKRFTPPTPDEVRVYASSIGYEFDAEKFCDFYAAKGWLVGKSPMKDWKAAVRNWRNSERSTPLNPPAYRKPPDPLGEIPQGPIVLPKRAAPREPEPFMVADPAIWDGLK
ncbi:hypothetical protein [Pseudomonas sp.]|uniref:hypothetical protein n=1 Tax=Pseudomonas sp. TaxID=306 RepID=UPI0033402E06